MRILVTNDDGIDAPGLEVMEEIARSLSDDVWMVAPLQEQSGQGRAITVSDAVRVDKRGEKRFRIEGTPTDCVVLGIEHLLGDKKPDLILSGVNNGQNVGEDTTQSGTIGACIQGMILGVPGIAFSQSKGFRLGKTIPWDIARHYGPKVLKRLMETGWPKDVVMNVNFPDCELADVQGVEITSQGMRDFPIINSVKRTDPRGRDYYWLSHGGPKSDPPVGTDLRCIYEDKISVSPLHVDLTHYAYRDILRESFGEL
ncbi:5'/3'-nucleotidase SurE [Hirschia litorea]|uniref:5'-nucleotidase SurE n=1 Tax=Hirschia litorea TaxID=1199156 RepID=A0ABW2IH51_9PROT